MLGATAEALPDGMAVVGRDGTLLFTNRRFAARSSIPEDVLSSRSFARVVQVMGAQVADPEAFAACLAYLEARPDDEAREAEATAPADGRTLERFAAPAKGTDGTPYGRVWRWHDVTERKKAEAEHSALRGRADRPRRGAGGPPA